MCTTGIYALKVVYSRQLELHEIHGMNCVKPVYASKKLAKRTSSTAIPHFRFTPTG